MEFHHDTAGSRYVLTEDSADGPHVVAKAEYRDARERIWFTHTEVDPDHEGQGLAGQLVRQALDDVRAQGRLIVPTCPYVRSYVERHPEYADLVDRDLLAPHLDQQD